MWQGGADLNRCEFEWMWRIYGIDVMGCGIYVFVVGVILVEIGNCFVIM